MSGSVDVARVLAERARKLATRSSFVESRTVDATAAIVSVGSERFAIPSDSVRGIVPLAKPLRLPGLPPQISGVVHFRGELISVVDLAAYLGTRENGAPRFLVVVRAPEGPIGLAVEEVVEFRTIHTDEVEDSDGGGVRPTRAITRDLVQVIDIPRLVSDEALIVQ